MQESPGGRTKAGTTATKEQARTHITPMKHASMFHFWPLPYFALFSLPDAAYFIITIYYICISLFPLVTHKSTWGKTFNLIQKSCHVYSACNAQPCVWLYLCVALSTLWRPLVFQRSQSSA